MPQNNIDPEQLLKYIKDLEGRVVVLEENRVALLNMAQMARAVEKKPKQEGL